MQSDTDKQDSGEALYMFGGISDGHVLADVHQLHKGRWSLCAHLPASVLGPSVVALPGSHAGATSSTVSSTSDSGDNKWTSTVPPLPRACAYLGLICASGSLVALGGSVSLDQLQPGSLADVLRLSDDQRCWEPLASMPRPCHSSDAVVFGEALYMFGGISDGHVLADVHQLHKGRWSLCAHLPASVLGPSVVALPGSHAGATSSTVSSTSDSGDNKSGCKDEDLIMWSWHNL
ncbi:hypothetical protein HPB51_024896 [Rhipicephalus microplus]|uniref:Uncharacterized protein n=1 Tax=Rhipicephalus microplus TaxID=6941 RepID=A0A9J6EPH3_RHIMP|nr:hypothetical protein HPB51_024896 [Rhipicephalus microplus]